MLRFSRTLRLALAVLSLGAAAHAPSAAKRLHATMAGRWTGSLRYRDYRDSTKFVTLPTLLDGVVEADSTAVRLDFTYDDGPGKTVKESDRFSLAGDAKTLTWGAAKEPDKQSRYTITSLTDGASIQFVAERDGEDNNKPARIRETVAASATELRILKEVRFAPDAPGVYRHEYRFQRR